MMLSLIVQHKTMQMMYEMVYKALQEVGLENQYHPQDYLNFFCLGNREEGVDTSNAGNQSAANTPQVSTNPLIQFHILFSDVIVSEFPTHTSALNSAIEKCHECWLSRHLLVKADAS